MLQFLTDSWELEEDKEGCLAHSNGDRGEEDEAQN